MAKRSVTQRLRQSLDRKLRRLNKEGISTGTLRQDIKSMNWRELKKLATPSKTGRSTFKGLKKYLNEEPRRNYYRETGQQSQTDTEIPYVDTGYNGGMVILELLMSYFNEPIPLERYTSNGKTISRSQSEIQEAEQAQNFLMNLFYTKATEIGFSEYGRQLEPYSQRIQDCISKALYGYGDSIKSSMNELATILNDGALSAQQYQEYSDFADTMMGDDFEM